MNDLQDRLRQLPQISVLLADPRVEDLSRGRRGAWVTRLVKDVVAGLRDDLREATGPVVSRKALTDQALEAITHEAARLLRPSLRRVVNATGVVVHTNLGRANLPGAAVEAAMRAAARNCDLEFDLASGQRGHRGRGVERKAALLTGAEDALIINNNAAALWLAVRLTAAGGPVILSRGEVVAIGGSFRLHEILAETGCRLVEVGTTNRTAVADYARALEPGAVILKVHRSNFTVEGFTEEASLAELATLCREQDASLVYDAGSGALFPFEQLGLPPGETELAADLATGADLVTCSGDKLLGGCQAGMILGRRALVRQLREHPMRRAFRVDKITLAALDSVLTTYLAAEGRPSLPTLDLLATPVAELQRRAEEILVRLGPSAPDSWSGMVVPGRASVGGGTFSHASVESRLVQWSGPHAQLERCHGLLRAHDPAVVGRLNQEGLALDVRTILPDEEDLVVSALTTAWGQM